MPDIDAFPAYPQGQAPSSEETNYAGSGIGLVDGIAITAGAANTKGSWVQMIASTAKKTVGIVVSIQKMGTTAHTFLIDIGTGAAASEVALITDLLYVDENANKINGTVTGSFFVEIPAGTRIAARCQSDQASDTVYIGITLMEMD